MRSVGLMLCALWLWGLPGEAQEMQETHYQIEAKLDTEAHTLVATQTLNYPNDGSVPLQAITFWLAPNAGRSPNPELDPVIVDAGYWNGFDPAWLKITEVTDGEGNALDWRYQTGPASLQTYSLEQNLLRVTLSQALEPGQSVVVRLKFETKFPNVISPDQGYHGLRYTWRFGWNPVAVPATELIEGEYLSDARPYYPQVYPAALYDLKLTVPSGYDVASGLNVEQLATQTESKTLRLSSDVPVRSIPLSLSPNFRRYTLPGSATPITVYYGPGEEAAARQIATYAADVLQAYSARWGAYGYPALTLVSSWRPGLFGMAADGIVILGNGAFREKDLTVAGMADRVLEHLVAHEIAHMWWGIGVGADFNAENFLSEAFAEYLSITYFEGKYGADGPNLVRLERQGLFESVVESQLGFLNLRQHFSELPYLVAFRDRFDEALVKPQKVLKYLNTNQERIYNKGYLVLRALGGLIGPDKMDALLLLAHQRFNHRLLDAKGLQALAEEVSGQNLDDFFADWVYGTASIDYAIEAVKVKKGDDGRYTTLVTLTRSGSGRLPVQLVLVTQDGEQLEQTWKPQSDSATLSFVTSVPLKEVQLDPHSWTPDTARINNYYPTRLRIIPDGKVDVPLDAYLIRADPVNRTVEGGYVLDYRWLVADGLVAFIFNHGRGNTVDGALTINEQILAEFGWNLTLFDHPAVGVTGQYWEPNQRLRLFISRQLDFEQEPVNFAGVLYSNSELLRGRTVYRVNVLGDPFSFGRLSASAISQSLLWPHVTLDAQLKLGYSVGALPDFLSFTLSEFNSFYAQTEHGKQKRFFPGRFKGFARLSVDFPLKRELSYSLAGLALVRQTWGNVYLAAGQTSDTLTALDPEAINLEAGFAATASGQMLGGLFSFSVTGGVAVALSEDPETRRLVPYFGFDVPFL